LKIGKKPVYNRNIITTTCLMTSGRMSGTTNWAMEWCFFCSDLRVGGRWGQWQATRRRVGTDGIVGSSGAAFPLFAGRLGGYVSLTPVPLLLEWDIHTLIL
jgi:hypothetical protein